MECVLYLLFITHMYVCMYLPLLYKAPVYIYIHMYTYVVTSYVCAYILDGAYDEEKGEDPD